MFFNKYRNQIQSILAPVIHFNVTAKFFEKKNKNALCGSLPQSLI